MRRIKRLLARSPLLRYIHAVEEGTRQQQEKVEEQKIITAIHVKRANWYFYERNHITPLVIGLVRGE